MKQNFRKAFNALKKIGCPVIEGWDDPNTFVINGEENYNTCWANYNCMGIDTNPNLDDFGVNHKINKILDANGLIAEWINTGVLGVYQD
jgi:hypothetical protein